VLPSPRPARRLHTDEVLHDLGRYLVVRVFDGLEQAAEWLEAESSASSAFVLPV
jgi:hypothetical protein